MSKKITVMVSWHEKSLESQYVEAAKDQGREQEAKEWEELSIRDGKNAAW